MTLNPVLRIDTQMVEAIQAQPTNAQIPIVLCQILLDGPPPVGERHPMATEIDNMQSISPTIAGPKTHACEHRELGNGINEVEIVAFTPGRFVPDWMHTFVIGIRVHRCLPVIEESSALFTRRPRSPAWFLLAPLFRRVVLGKGACEWVLAIGRTQWVACRSGRQEVHRIGHGGGADFGGLEMEATHTGDHLLYQLLIVDLAGHHFYPEHIAPG